MAIFRGTGGSGSSSDSTIVDAVTAQAGIANTKADEAEGFRDEAEGFKNTASTAATTATTKASEASDSADTASDKATEANTAKGLAEDAQTAAENARDAALGHADTANSSAVQTVAGSNTQVVGVYNNIANVNTVAGVNTDVTTVAGISSDVTTVAADASDIGTVSTNIANVNNVGNNIANVNAVHGNASNINTVAADGTDIGTVATNIANVNTVAGISSTVTTVAGLESKMDTVIADASDIGAVAGNIGDVTTVAGINSDVDTVAGIAAKVTTVADNITDVQNADTNATNAASSASNASASATSASNSATTATTKATEASNSATAASNSATTATTKASQAAGSATTAGTSASTATTKASEASASATTATTKAGEAASSASAASGDATTATTKASEASASAASASTSATDSSNAASTWNNFYNSYLGVADAPPSVDVLGNPIVAGALYYDTGAGSNAVGLYVYNGSSWVYSTNYNNVTAPYSLSQDLATNSNDISFGDNAKAQFGASDDLQIYHDGSNSYIKDAGVGNLLVLANDFRIRNASGNEDMLQVNQDGQVKISYDGSTKLATTNTGIDVTGTATMDGLTVDASSTGRATLGTFSNTANAGGTEAAIALRNSTTGDCDVSLVSHRTGANHGSDFYIETSQSSGGVNKKRFNIAEDGDISFYEDTGTTPKFFWDASAERLGIGTTSPQKRLHVNAGSTNEVGRFESTDGTAYLSIMDNATSTSLQGVGSVGNNLTLYANNAERLRIDSSGNVGIGTTSPATALHVDSGVYDVAATLESSDSAVRLSFADSGSTGNNHISLESNEWYIYSNSTERMRIDSSGNVGIGTSSPEKTLHINSGTGNIGIRVESSDSEAEIEFMDSTTTGTLQSPRIGGVGDSLFMQTNGSERMRISSSGNVGIGTTTSPDALLTIDKDVSTAYSSTDDSAQRSNTNTLLLKNEDGTENSFAQIAFDLAGSNQSIARIVGINDGTSTSALAFVTEGSNVKREVMRLDGSGNVGIGTTSPAAKLAVHGGTSGTDVDVASFNSASGALNIQCSDLAAANPTWTLRTFAGEPIAFAQATSERMRIDSSGNVGIGTSSPNYSLTSYKVGANANYLQVVNGSSGPNAANGILYGLDGAGNGIINKQGAGDLITSVAGAERMRIDSSGNVLVGTTTTDIADATSATGIVLNNGGWYEGSRDGGTVGYFNRLSSNGDIVSFRKDGQPVGSISVTSSATSYNTSSDERLKENIQDAEDAGSKIDGMRIRQFDWKSDGSHQDYGVVAQELAEVAPEAVTVGETEDDMMSVDYSKLVPTLIKEIQTLRNRVAQLENN